MAARLVLALAVLLYLALTVWGYVEITSGWTSALNGLYQFQTLVGGVLAIFGAALGAWFLARQTAQSDRHERERQVRRANAIRTVLPLSLSAITRYSVDAGIATKVLLDQCKGENLPDRAKLRLPDLPTLPLDAILTVRDMVEAIPVRDSAPLAALIADVQIQAARLAETIAKAGDQEKIMARVNLEEYVIDCARIYARAGSLFAFARGEVSRVPQTITWFDLQQALYFFGMLDDAYDRVRATMLRRSKDDLDNIVEERWSREF